MQNQAVYLAGLDPARTRDYCAFTGCRIEDDKASAVTIARLIGVHKWPHIMYPVIERDVMDFDKRYPWKEIAIDATNEKGFMEQLKYVRRLPMFPIVYTGAVKEQMIADAIYMMEDEPTRVFTPTKMGLELKSQLQELERKTTNAGHDTFRHPVGKHDDLAWAFVMMLSRAKEYVYRGNARPMIYTHAMKEGINNRWEEVMKGPGRHIVKEDRWPKT